MEIFCISHISLTIFPLLGIELAAQLARLLKLLAMQHHCAVLVGVVFHYPPPPCAFLILL